MLIKLQIKKVQMIFKKEINNGTNKNTFYEILVLLMHQTFDFFFIKRVKTFKQTHDLGRVS